METFEDEIYASRAADAYGIHRACGGIDDNLFAQNVGVILRRWADDIETDSAI